MSATRDLSPTFFKMRKASKDALNTSDPEIKIAVPLISNSPSIYETADQIINIDNETLQRLNKLMNELDLILKDKKKNIFNDDKINELVKRENKCIELIRQGLAIIQNDAKKLKALESQATTPQEKTVIHNRLLNVAQSCSTLSARYRSYKAAAKLYLPDDDLDVPQETHYVSHADYQQLLELDDLNAQSAARNAAILKLAKQVTELAELFHQLDTMIITQGEVLDRIDYQIEQTSEKVKKGTADLVKAKQHQDKSVAIKTAACVGVVTVAAVGTAVALSNRR